MVSHWPPKKIQKDTPYLGHNICGYSAGLAIAGKGVQWIRKIINILEKLGNELRTKLIFSFKFTVISNFSDFFLWEVLIAIELVLRVSWDPNVNAIGNFSTSPFVIGNWDDFQPQFDGTVMHFFKLQNLNIYVKKTNKYCSLVMAEVEHNRLKGLNGHLSIIPEVHICISAAPS